MEFLVQTDHYVFQKINLDWTNGFFDWIFPNITDLHKNPWTLAFIAPLIGLWLYRQRVRALRWLLCSLVAVGLADLISYRLVKSQFGRLRPAESGVSYQLRTHSHSGSSFPSNHSANMFAAATTLSAALPAGAPAFYGVATLIAYSRVYVGVHFPLDVLGGALIGTTIGFALRKILRRWLNGKSPPQ